MSKYEQLTTAEEDVFRRLEAGEHMQDIAASFRTTARHFRRWLDLTVTDAFERLKAAFAMR